MNSPNSFKTEYEVHLEISGKLKRNILLITQKICIDNLKIMNNCLFYKKINSVHTQTLFLFCFPNW